MQCFLVTAQWLWSRAAPPSGTPLLPVLRIGEYVGDHWHVTLMRPPSRRGAPSKMVAADAAVLSVLLRSPRHLLGRFLWSAAMSGLDSRRRAWTRMIPRQRRCWRIGLAGKIRCSERRKLYFITTMRIRSLRHLRPVKLRPASAAPNVLGDQNGGPWTSLANGMDVSSSWRGFAWARRPSPSSTKPRCMERVRCWSDSCRQTRPRAVKVQPHRRHAAWKPRA